MPTGKFPCISTKGLKQRFPELLEYQPAVRYLWRQLIRTASTGGREVTISVARFVELVASPCHYCGSLPWNMTKQPDIENIAYNGVDRVDNALGYIPGNVVAACKTCNDMKSKLDLEVFVAQVERIGRHRRMGAFAAPVPYRGVRLGNWLFADGDLYRIVGWSRDGYPLLANWSRPRIDFIKALLFRARRAFA